VEVAKFSNSPNSGNHAHNNFAKATLSLRTTIGHWQANEERLSRFACT
ncbi:hypothetical protein X975_21031, partial [Stegodyphus mimosarum]